MICVEYCFKWGASRDPKAPISTKSILPLYLRRACVCPFVGVFNSDLHIWNVASSGEHQGITNKAIIVPISSLLADTYPAKTPN